MVSITKNARSILAALMVLLSSLRSPATAQQYYPENILSILNANNYAANNKDPPSSNNNVNFYNKPIYIDTISSVCPIVYYPQIQQNKFRVAKNCSNLNLASNWTSILTPNDKFFITELLLANNMFQFSLPYLVINNYDSLTGLDLSYNFINENLNDLRQIDCSRCDLKELNLTGNLFTRFPTFRNNCMYQIETLRLDRNILLTTLDYSFSYYRMPRLTYLDLSYCSIRYINTPGNVTILEQFPRLEYLNLAGNKLKIIYENPFAQLYFLLYLNFELNAIDCVQPNLWLKRWLITRQLYSIELANNLKLSTLYSPTCSGCLTNLTNKILTLPDTAFCTDIYLTTSILVRDNIKVDWGKSVDLDCQLYSIPASDLWWTYNDRVLSKTVTQDSPYEFIENFSFDPYATNKSSVLRIKNFNDNLSGVYSCNAWYLDINPNYDRNKIKSIKFGVSLNEVTRRKMGLGPGEIAAIVIGAILGFLLLCCLCCLCAWCCCYKRGWCCCFAVGGDNKKSSTSTTHLYSSKARCDFDEHSSGFNELNKTKPNYVINTVCKSNGGGAYLNEPSCATVAAVSTDYLYKTPNQVECSSSWRAMHSPVTTHKKITIIEDKLCPINNNDTYVYNVKESIKTSNNCDEHYVTHDDVILGDNYEIRHCNGNSYVQHHHLNSQQQQMQHDLAETSTEFETHHFVSSPTHHIHHAHLHTNINQQPAHFTHAHYQQHHNARRPTSSGHQEDQLVSDANFFNQVIITDEGNTYNIMSPATAAAASTTTATLRGGSNKQYAMSPSGARRVISTNACFKYDSDV
jgi:hypothetical protein